MREEEFLVSELQHQFGDSVILRDLEFRIQKGEIVGVVGPNGAGKTTLLRILGGLLNGWQGQVSFRTKDLRTWGRSEFSRCVAYLAQRTEITFPYTAREIALMGRLPHQEGVFFETQGDLERAEDALKLTGCAHLADRYFNELSGGEQQLVGLASALCQEPEVLLLDEPTAFLDLRHQLQIYRILNQLHKEKRLTLILVTHDLNLAQSFCSRLLFLKAGQLRKELSREKEDSPIRISTDLIEEVFDIKARLSGHDSEGRITLSYGE